MEQKGFLNEPFLMKPAGKDYLWGGKRLKDEFAKEINMDPLAETWECSTHPDGPSIVFGGKFSGKTLREVLAENPRFLGTHPDMNGEFPILIKLIDANSDLSIQVHPDDVYAMEKENGQFGKSEMWYVLDALEDAKLIYGLRHDTEKDVLKKSIREGNIEKYLKKYPIKKNDIFFIEAGTIHAIGAGALIAEIQENSNLTYRLFDYNRVDKGGNRRELHIDKALDVADFSSAKEPRQPMRVLNYRPGVASELLCRCKYFEVHRMLVNTCMGQRVTYRADSLSFRVLLCIEGSGSITYSKSEEKKVISGQEQGLINITKGDCVFVPADSVEMVIKGNMEFLDVRG
ncbi:MAG: class I mannose-6-phosphate isomerase [Lachnospiraceae bacterium]|nr:class I mannose-6-phosphate isomerase [Lachnospiraceae bacterium]